MAVAALVVAGPGASAAIDTYVSQASGTTLSLSVNIPALNGTLQSVLGNAGVSGAITERISFSNATANVTETKSEGTALGQVFFGSLDNALRTVAGLLGKSKLPEARARVGNGATTADGAQSDALAAVDIGPIHIGAGETSATAKTVGRLVETTSMSRLLGIKVDLASVLSQGAIADLLKPLTDLIDGSEAAPNDGLVDKLNGLLGGVEQTLEQTTGTKLDLSIPEVKTLLNKPLLEVGIIESRSITGFAGAARTAKGVTNLANVSLLGGFITLDAVNIESFASIDGTAAGAKASGVQRLVGLKVGDNIVNLNAGSIQVLGKTVALPVEITKLLNLTVEALGLKVAVAERPQITRTATHARAATSSLHLELAPKLLGNTALFSIALDGPAAVADVRGGSVLGVKEIKIPTTGISDAAMLFVGPMLIGLAIVVRRFALVK